MKQVSFILIGATGDLSITRLLPALYHLLKKNEIELQVVAIGRESSTANDLITNARTYIKNIDEKTLKKLETSIMYLQADILHNDIQPFIASLNLHPERIVYCATPSSLFVPIAQKMHALGVLDKNNNLHRIVLEKPFGTNQQSAQEMNNALHAMLDEKQIYRIDHYLSKELVSSLTILRKANVFFEPIWSNKYIDRIEIIAYEKDTVHNRAAFYDATGALADMIQNHLLQLVALLAMEIPDDVDTNPEALHRAKAEILSNVHVQETLLGQYEGYTGEDSINSESKTETFAAIKLTINNNQWNHVPWYVATGKALKEKRTEILIKFKSLSCPFVGPCYSNYLHIYLTPQEGFDLTINMKQPHKTTGIQSVDVKFCYSCLFETESPEAYEVLLREIIAGERLLTVSSKEIEMQWSIIDQAKKKITNFMRYPQGSSNPAERFIEEL